MENIFDYFRNRKLKRLEKKLKRYKPQIINSWYSKLDEEIRQEYEEEQTKLQDEIFYLKKELANEHRNMEYWHGKYDAQKEVYDGIKNNMIQKVESTAMKAGEQKEQIKNLKTELKDKE